MSPKLSIIVPVYNVSSYIVKCVDSLIKQTYNDFEIILVNDGSTDDSFDKCQQLKNRDSRIILIDKENGGVSSARNIGMELAKGRWVTFVDSDDFVDPNFFEHLMEATKDENIDFVHAGCMNYAAGQIMDCNQKYDEFESSDPAFLFNSFRGLIVSKLFKRELLNHFQVDIRFDEKMHLAEDMAFTMDYVARVKKYKFLSETGYYYRRDNGKSLTKTVKRLSYDTQKANFQHIYNSTNTYITLHSLSEKDIEFRQRQLALGFLEVIKSIYWSGYSYKERIKILRKDWDDGHYNLLKYILWKDLIGRDLILKKKYFLFDIVQKFCQGFRMVKNFSRRYSDILH